MLEQRERFFFEFFLSGREVSWTEFEGDHGGRRSAYSGAALTIFDGLPHDSIDYCTVPAAALVVAAVQIGSAALIEPPAARVGVGAVA